MKDALDGDIKHAAIIAMGRVLVACSIGSGELAAAQERLASQLHNEITRSGAVQVIGMLATSGADISPVLG